MEATLRRLEQNIADNTGFTLQIKERLDKQNGLIPHMSDAVKAMAARQETMMKQLNSDAVSDAGTRAKMGIIWAMVGAIGMAVLGYVLKGFLG